MIVLHAETARQGALRGFRLPVTLGRTMGVGPADSAPESGATADDESGELDSLLQQVARIPDVPTRVPEPDRTGRKLGHYRIRSRLGQGGMGIVYSAEDTRLRRKVALKVLPVAMVADDERRRRFMREARSVAAMLHPNLAAVFDVGEADGTVFLAMEHVDGITLRQRLDDGGGRLEPAEAVRIAREIARGLGKAHSAGVIHRDLKPENVMIAADGTVKVLDFGLAKLSSTPELDADADDPVPDDDLASRVGKVLGTPGYMSPEQAAGSEVDARSDVFSFGVMLYEMLAGARPFRGRTTRELLRAIEGEVPPSIRDVAREVPAPLVRLVERCLSKDRADRFADGESILAELDRVDRELTVAPRSLAVRAGSVALVVLGGAVVWLVAGALRRAPEQQQPSAEPPNVPAVVAPQSIESTAVVPAASTSTAIAASSVAPPASASVTPTASRAKPVPAAARPVAPRASATSGPSEPSKPDTSARAPAWPTEFGGP